MHGHPRWIGVEPERLPLARLVDRVGQAVTAHYRRTVSAHGIGATALGVLGVLAEDDALSHRELAGGLGVTPATLTPVIDVLAAEGAVVRKRDPDDRRVVRLWITPAGRDRLESTVAAVAATLRERIPDPPADQQPIIRGYLLAVLAAIDDGAHDDPGDDPGEGDLGHNARAPGGG